VLLAARRMPAIGTIAARITKSGGIALCVRTDITSEESIAILSTKRSSVSMSSIVR